MEEADTVAPLYSVFKNSWVHFCSLLHFWDTKSKCHSTVLLDTVTNTWLYSVSKTMSSYHGSVSIIFDHIYICPRHSNILWRTEVLTVSACNHSNRTKHTVQSKPRTRNLVKLKSTISPTLLWRTAQAAVRGGVRSCSSSQMISLSYSQPSALHCYPFTAQL